VLGAAEDAAVHEKITEVREMSVSSRAGGGELRQYELNELLHLLEANGFTLVRNRVRFAITEKGGLASSRGLYMDVGVPKGPARHPIKRPGSNRICP